MYLIHKIVINITYNIRILYNIIMAYYTKIDKNYNEKSEELWYLILWKSLWSVKAITVAVPKNKLEKCVN